MGRVLVLFLAGCTGGTFVCASDPECHNRGVQGSCEVTSMCSFPDTSCGSGRRYGELSGAFASECVAPETPDAAVAEVADAPPDAAPDAMAVDPLIALGDEFQGTTLAPEWTSFGSGVTVTVSGGELELVPTERMVWYQGNRGFLLHKSVTGNVRVTGRVQVRDQAGDPLTNNVHIAGLMVRNGASATENYVFIGVGQLDGLSVETKSTTDSQTVLDNPAWPSGDAELRLCRLGAEIRLYKRPIGGGAWTLAAVHARPDLPDTLQVGVFVSADTTPPDLRAQVDEVRFATPEDVADCTSG